MFTNNAKSYFNKKLGLGTISEPHIPVPYKTPSVNKFKNNLWGDDITAILKKLPTAAITGASYNSGAYFGTIFGDGTGTPSANDTKLFGNHLSQLTNSNVTVSVEYNADDNDAKQSVKAVYTITNTTGAELTIREMGLLYEIAVDHTYDYNHAVLMEHSVLDTPITIPVGGVGQVTYTIEMDYPTFQ